MLPLFLLFIPFQFFPGNVAVGYGVGGHRTATCIKGYGIQYHETEKIKEMLEWLRKYIAEKKSAARL